MTLLSVTDETMVNPLRVPATTGARARAVIIDAVLISILGVALMGASILVLHRPHLTLLGTILAVIVLIREADLTLTGYSVGGRIAGVRWVDARTDNRPGIGMFFHADLVLITIVPTLGFGSLLLLSSAAKDKNLRGWHDRISGLIAVSTKNPLDEDLEEFDQTSLLSSGTVDEIPEELYRADAEDHERPGLGEAPVSHSVYESSRNAHLASGEQAEAKSEAPVFESVAAAAGAAGAAVLAASTTPEPEPVAEVAPEAKAKVEAPAETRAQAADAQTEVLPVTKAEPVSEPASDTAKAEVEPAAVPEADSVQAEEPAADAAEVSDVVNEPETATVPGATPQVPAAEPVTETAAEESPEEATEPSEPAVIDDDLELAPAAEVEPAEQASDLAEEQRHAEAEAKAEFEQVAQSLLGASEPAAAEVVEPARAEAADAVAAKATAAATPEAVAAPAGTVTEVEEIVAPAVESAGSGNAFPDNAVVPPVSKGSAKLNALKPFNTAGAAATAGTDFVAVSATGDLDADESSSFGVVPPVEELVGAPRSAPSPSERDDHYELVKEVFARRAAARAAKAAASETSGPSIATFDAEDPVSPEAVESAEASPESSSEVVDDTLIDANLVDGQTTDEAMIEVPEGESLDSYFADALINDDDAISAESDQADPAEQACTASTDGPSPAFVDDRSDPVMRLMPFTNAGKAIHVTGPTIIGRAPLNTSRYPEAKLVALGDSAPSVSKTHAAMMPTEHGILVTDLGSSNGTRVVRAGKARRIPTDVAVMVHEGGVVLLGQTAYRVQR